MIVATWNAENLFRPGSGAGPADDAAYERKLQTLAQVIDELAPDVLALQEVGQPEALADLVLRLEGDCEVALSRFPDDRGIRTAFLSRTPPTDVTDVRELPPRLEPVQVHDDGTRLGTTGRGLLRIRVEPEGRPVDLVTGHLKSKLLSYAAGRFEPRDEDERARYGAYALNLRAAEAATLRAYANDLLDGEGRSRAVVVLGDLNDEAQAATTQILLGPPGSEIGTGGFGQDDRGDAWRLWNLAPLIPEERRFTRVYRGRPEMIDHILVSHELVKRVESVDTVGAEPRSITDDRAARRNEPASDHRPVVARFA